MSRRLSHRWGGGGLRALENPEGGCELTGSAGDLQQVQSWEKAGLEDGGTGDPPEGLGLMGKGWEPHQDSVLEGLLLERRQLAEPPLSS